MDALRHGYERLLASYPAPDRLALFLNPGIICRNRKRAGLDAALDPLLLRTARAIAENEALSRLLWHCYLLTFYQIDYAPLQFRLWPKLEYSLGELSGIFYLLILLRIVPRIERIHHALHVPASITRDTLYDIVIAVDRHKRFCKDRPGVLALSLPWYRKHFQCTVFRTGRMEYLAEPFNYPVRIFQSRKTREVLALSHPDIKYNTQGLVFSENTKTPEQFGFKSVFEINAQYATGNPLLPAGSADPVLLKLDHEIWKEITADENYFLAMHIPHGGKMDLPACYESFRHGLSFFSKIYPERSICGIMCSSWIFNPELESIYAQGVNLLNLQRDSYLFPVASRGDEGALFIFDCASLPQLSELPRNTSLQRAVAMHLEKGGILRNGGMFLLREQTKNKGRQWYRNQKWIKKIKGETSDHCPGLELIS
ncbi:MAG: hypothetical protein A2096_07860 [Spirochaetes bacterium GWF1_41_5]|nr:MAG: hypothetical protein A2096_07860 [Spirochaetes bacterium GWF1_41_5]